ncbi:MAG: hypothetical protein OK438_08345 [Thaumarchaeota archaeon]|nr:hypothetical protein [Nitrososphaerota archaeon]
MGQKLVALRVIGIESPLPARIAEAGDPDVGLGGQVYQVFPVFTGRKRFLSSGAVGRKSELKETWRTLDM